MGMRHGANWQRCQHRPLQGSLLYHSNPVYSFCRRVSLPILLGGCFERTWYGCIYRDVYIYSYPHGWAYLCMGKGGVGMGITKNSLEGVVQFTTLEDIVNLTGKIAASAARATKMDTVVDNVVNWGRRSAL